MKEPPWFRFSSVVRLSVTIGMALVTGSALRADAVFAWNELLLQLAARSRELSSPIVEARVFAVTHLAVDEAVRNAPSSAVGERRLHGQRAAAVCAAHDVVVALVPGAVTAAGKLAESHLGTIPDGDEKTRGMAAGRAAAAGVLQRRTGDRWIELATFESLSPAPESFEAASERMMRGDEFPVSPWSRALPFALKSVKQFEVREVRTFNRSGGFSIDSGISFSSLFDHVDRATVQQSPNEGWSRRPVATWNQIARQLAMSRALDISQQARMLAVLNVALADATISCVHWRCTVGQWRKLVGDEWQPIEEPQQRSTDIVVQVGDGTRTQILRQEQQQILIPPTPYYPSPAATLAGAAQAALTAYFKTDRIAFALPDFSEHARKEDAKAESPIRTFATVSAAARECAYVASLQGVHSRESCIAGYLLGESIGRYVSKRTLAAR